MTELMKRYEEKYGNSPWEEVLTEDFNLFIYDEFKRIERENAKLKDQLTWRPVSDELPSVEKDGDAIMGRHKDVDEGLVQVDCISTIWFLDNYERWFTHWLPIPEEGV